MIRMRTNKEDSAQCCECGNNRDESLELFDVCIGGHISTICDVCNEALLSKTLVATCKVNSKIKQPHDMAIIKRRHTQSCTKKASKG